MQKLITTLATAATIVLAASIVEKARGGDNDPTRKSGTSSEKLYDD